MEEERAADGRFLEVLVHDLRNGDGRLPLLVGVVYRGQAASTDKGELATLEQHATVSAGETSAALGAIGGPSVKQEESG